MEKETLVPQYNVATMGLSSKVKIRTPNGMHLTIGNIIGKRMTQPNVYSYAAYTERVTQVRATVSVGPHVEQVLEITMETGEKVSCAEGYLFLLEDFATYKHACELKPLDRLAGMMWKPHNSTPYLEEVLKHTLTVSEIRPIKYNGAVYNVYTPGLDNFAVEVGERVSIFVHSGVCQINEPVSTEV